jgi:hypothetical protein
MNIDFYAKYIDINFDNSIDTDLVNSQEFYLKYKKDYFDQTQLNYVLYKNLCKELSSFSDLYTINNTQYTYTYIDMDKIKDIQIKIKTLIKSQNNLLDNFNHYISILNTNKTLFKPKTKQKKFFSKFKFN